MTKTPETNEATTFATTFELSAPGYERLGAVLAAAFEQASAGKGKERHANDLPFEDQPMQTIAANHGIGFITGQARKKMEEALGMFERGQHDQAIRELLGTIVYTAGAVIFIEDRKPMDVTELRTE